MKPILPKQEVSASALSPLSRSPSSPPTGLLLLVKTCHFRSHGGAHLPPTFVTFCEAWTRLPALRDPVFLTIKSTREQRCHGDPRAARLLRPKPGLTHFNWIYLGEGVACLSVRSEVILERLNY